MHSPSVPGPVQVIAGEPLRGQRLCRRLERLGFAVQANAPQGPAQAGTEAGHAPDAGTVLRSVFWHSVALALLVGVLVMLQAYVWPGMVPAAR